MLRFILSASAVAALSTAAVAADLPLPVEPMPVAPAVAPTYNWTGFYIGAQSGYGWGDSHIDDNGATGLDTDFDIEGGFVGGLAGALWQWNQIVLGVEVEGSASWVDGSQTVPPPGDNSVSTTIDSFGSLSGKLGFAWERVLFFGTGGLAVGDIETAQSVPSLGVSFSDDAIYWGWTAGGGIDFAVTNNIIFGAQYRYYDFGSEDFTPAAPFTARDQDVTLHTVSGHVTVKFP
jgi:outer membrane immunogenic protein